MFSNPQKEQLEKDNEKRKEYAKNHKLISSLEDLKHYFDTTIDTYDFPRTKTSERIPYNEIPAYHRNSAAFR